MILIIKTNTESLHDLEFVKPIEEILKKQKIKFKTIHYEKLKKHNLAFAKKIIITGTSLQDDKFLEDIEKFSWIKNFRKPVLGICSGMQIISLAFASEIRQKTEIGFYSENFIKEFLDMSGKKEVYHLHNNYAITPYEFEDFSDSEIPQAIKHKTKNIYGILFHPEVRNEKLIIEFSK
jgi:GMP synthase (glutamine-hydrolysing)